MSTNLTPLPSPTRIPARIAKQQTPILFAVDRKAEKRFWEFFTANIRNKNTRMAYLTACYKFSDWCDSRGVDLEHVEPMIVAAYIETLTQTYSPATVKQHLAGIRMLYDWLVVGQIVSFNPASSVRGPKHVVKTGKTPVLNPEEARELIESIDTSTVVGLRDRALIGVMIYSFARVSAAVSMLVKDYYHQGRRSFFRLHEKGGKYQSVPAHHVAQEYLDAYLEEAAIDDLPASPLFRSSGRGRAQTLTDRSMTRHTAIQMVKRRSFDAGLPYEICNHSFRGTGITEYLRNDGDLETAARIAGHESTRTTQLYNRINEELSLDEIERIRL